MIGVGKMILELAQHKTSRAVWATAPWETLRWGNQEPIWPVSASALRAVPSPRIQYLARPKRDFSAEEEQRKEEEEEASFSRKTRHPSSETLRYQNIVRLSTPKARSRSLQEAGSLHNGPARHQPPRAKTALLTPRLLQLSSPKRVHPDFQSDRESVASVVSTAALKAGVSQRLRLLSLPRLKESNICLQLGRPEEPIWTVSRAAKKASATAHVKMLAAPKQLSEEYLPPRGLKWIREMSV